MLHSGWHAIQAILAAASFLLAASRIRARNRAGFSCAFGGGMLHLEILLWLVTIAVDLIVKL